MKNKNIGKGPEKSGLFFCGILNPNLYSEMHTPREVEPLETSLLPFDKLRVTGQLLPIVPG
jgi:hypothetical protein